MQEHIASEIQLGKANVLKELIVLESKNKAESIYFKRQEKQVICISTQISCNIGCIFCASPNKGKTYNLTAEEMVSQVESMYGNVVNDIPLLISFMGEGEPFSNYTETIKAMHMLEDMYNCRLSISTVGVNLKKFSKESFKVPVKLQISIHSLDSKIRKELMPFSPSFDKIKSDLHLFKENRNIKIDLNFTLIDSINDRHIDMENIFNNLYEYHIKISKLNKVTGTKLKKSLNCDNFVKYLSERGVSVEYHETDGESNMSACGQTSGLLK